MSDVFLLTKSPLDPRTELCLKLLERSSDSRLFLMGDGVYNVLRKDLRTLLADKIYACEEDLQARGIIVKNVLVLEDFYEQMSEAVMEADHAYAF